MPFQPSVTQIRLKKITKCLAATATSLEVLASGLKEPSLEVISHTTKSLLKNLESDFIGTAEAATQFLMIAEPDSHVPNPHCILKDPCAMALYPYFEKSKFTSSCWLDSEKRRRCPNWERGKALGNHGNSSCGSGNTNKIRLHITLHKINTFIEAQQKESKIKRFFRQGELGTLPRNCKEGLRQGLDAFQIELGKVMKDITDIQKESDARHEEVLHLIETLSDTGSDQDSTISRVFSGPHNSSTSISMLPSEPKIFYSRDSEVSDILQLFKQGALKIAILGAGGMGKTTVATAILHHTGSTARFDQHRHFVACDSATTKVELAALIAVHLGLKPGKDLTGAVVQHICSGPPSLLILDNLETVWEPMESCHAVKEFLSLLTDVKHLALMVTMRGAERPAKSLAHLVDTEGCSKVLSCWEEEKTSMISDGHDKRSNLELSISLSLSSPRLKAFPHSLRLLSLLSMLPNGLSNVELVQSKLPLNDTLGCKATLIGTSLAYIDPDKRLKVLVPMREYIEKIQQPTDDLIRPLRRYFQELLELNKEYQGTASGSSIPPRISPILANIQNVLQKGLQQGHPDLCPVIIGSMSGEPSSDAPPVRPDTITPVIKPGISADHSGHMSLCSSYMYSRPGVGILRVSSLRIPLTSFIGDVDTVITQGLTHVEQCNDPDVKCAFYLALASFYMNIKSDLPGALNFCQNVLNLASSAENTKRHAQALNTMAWINWLIGSYSTGQAYAEDSQRLARISADLYKEAYGLNIEAYGTSVALFLKAAALRPHGTMNTTQIKALDGFRKVLATRFQQDSVIEIYVEPFIVKFDLGELGRYSLG
ncbi:hypothetical protein DFH06DRAFT_1148458 [Mycena polygramma]|nr:hypothetical protein DFH06DRAFT_1148458 [Mycena polygramma]